MRPVATLAILVTAFAAGCAADFAEARMSAPISDVVFDELSGEVWAFERRVSGRAPEGCVTVEIKRGPFLLRVPVREARFSAIVPLSPGENVVGAYCADPATRARDARAVYLVRLPATPRAVARVVAAGRIVTLDAISSEPNEGTDVPLVSFRWSGDPSNPGPLVTTRGTPLDGADGARIELATPEVDGEYVVWLTVVDAARRSDRAGVVFVVEGGEARRIDRTREPPSWADEAIVYGVVPFLHGEPAIDAARERLPRLAELGVNTLWLSPIYESPEGDFGYAVTDHFRVRRDWGTNESLRALVDRAHALGMRVVLDFVPNHTSSEHRYFRHASRYGTRSPYWAFYDRDEAGRPTYYFDWEHLPNLDYDNPDVRRFIIEAFAYWTREIDVDGFRVDVAWGVADRAPGFFAELREELARIEPNVLLIAEASARDPRYFDNGFDAAYDWTDEVGQWAWRDVFHAGRADVAALHEALVASPTSPARVLRFLDNNDTGERFATRHGRALERVASALLFTLPGIPALFTGQEDGAEYHPYARREPLDVRPDPDRFAHYRSLASLRASEEALRKGRFVPLEVEGATGVYAFARLPEGDARAVVVVLGFSGESEVARVRLSPDIVRAIEGRRPVPLLGEGSPRIRRGELVVRLRPHDARAWAFD